MNRTFTFFKYATFLLCLFAGKAFAVCNTPVVSILSILNDSVTIQWTNISGATYEYEILASTAPPPTVGTNTTSMTLIGKGGLSYSSYKVWVRADCGGGDFSNWASIPFTVTCGQPSISFSNLTETSVDVSWPKISNTATYEYVIDNSINDPSSSGNILTTNTVTLSPLTAGTSYYAHFRTKCDGSTYSSWLTRNFSTKFPENIIELDKNTLINIYPNPVISDLVFVRKAGLQNGQLTVINSLGLTVLRESVYADRTTFSVREMPSGVYFARYSDGQNVYTSKIIKQ